MAGGGLGPGGPWARLRSLPHVTLGFDRVAKLGGGGVHWSGPEGEAILLDPDLGQVERRCVLAHELGHVERGGGAWRRDAPELWAPVVARDEAACDRAALDLLIDWARLAHVLAVADDMGDTVTAAEVAEDQGVTEVVARMAMRVLLEQRPGWRDAG